jgi:hypothetical protein
MSAIGIVLVGLMILGATVAYIVWLVKRKL